MRTLFTSVLATATAAVAGQTVHFTVDYDLSEENHGASYVRYGWDFNSGYLNPPHEGKYTMAVVAFDSLHDANTETGYAYHAVEQIYLDTIHFAMGHVNLSGMNDTVIVDVVALNATGYPTNTVLWSDTIITSTSLTGPSWLNFGAFAVVPPPLIITPPSKVGVKLRYYGPFQDTAGFLGGHRQCGAACPIGASGITHSTFANSFYYYTGDSINQPGSNTLYNDCNGNGQKDSCENWFIQNIGIWIDVTIDNAEGVTDGSSKVNLAVFPNPSRGVVFITSESELTEPVIEVYDAIGRFINAKRFLGTAAMNTPLDLSALPSGWYTIVLRSDEGVDYRLVLRQ